MKLVEGGKYKTGFIAFPVGWLLFSIFAHLFGFKEPGAIGFSCSVLVLVAVQLYSGVVLDGYWVASVSRRKQPVFFFFVLLGQIAIAVMAVRFG